MPAPLHERFQTYPHQAKIEKSGAIRRSATHALRGINELLVKTHNHELFNCKSAFGNIQNAKPKRYIMPNSFAILNAISVPSIDRLW